MALFVVLAHIDAWDNAARTAIGGAVIIAVNFFFLISGFYMALVLSRKYGDPLDFYKARAKRLFPIYWATLAVSLVVMSFTEGPLFGIAVQHWKEIWEAGDWMAMVTLAFSNLTFIGLDLGQMIMVEGAEITNYTLLPQSWTLGIELTFYAIIPFILRYGWPAIIGALGMSIAVKIGLIVTGLHVNPWERQIFFAVLYYFMLGVVAFKLYDRYEAELVARRGTCWIFSIALGGLLLVYAPLADNIDKNHKLIQDTIFHPLMFGLFTLVIPFVFALTKNSLIDRIIGELSYPLYIGHLTAITVSLAIIDLSNGWLRTAIHLAFTLMFSGVLVWIFERQARRDVLTLILKYNHANARRIPQTGASLNN